MSDTVNTNDPTQAQITQLLSDTHGEGVSSTRSLNQLYTIAENCPTALDMESIAEHIHKSDRMRVKTRLYAIADVLVRKTPDDAASLFHVIQEDLNSPDINSDISQDDFRKMRGHIFNILYTATSAGVELSPRLLEELYAGIVEYPELTSAERTVDILGSLVANDSFVAERATEILIELSALPGDDQISSQFKKYATAGLAGLLDEHELPNSADVDLIKQNIEENRSLLEDGQESGQSVDPSDNSIIDRLIGHDSNGGGCRDD